MYLNGSAYFLLMKYLTTIVNASSLTKIPYMLTAINIIVGIKAKKEEPVAPTYHTKNSTNSYFYKEKSLKKSTFKKSFSLLNLMITLLRKVTRVRI